MHIAPSPVTSGVAESACPCPGNDAKLRPPFNDCRESIPGLFDGQGASDISLEPTIRLFHHRWSVPIVARLHLSGPMTFATLATRFAASRDTLTDTLARLETNGVVERQHPGKRTVYSLTPLGQAVGATCVPLVELVAETNALEVALKKWPMLVITALGRGATRYNEAKAALPGITARALAIALKDLQADEMVTRTVDQGYPPTPTYLLSARGMLFYPALDALARACEEAGARPIAVGETMPLAGTT
ncbi:MAG: winged helix-turn-helix transcriptional regulator [bacterium]